MKEKSEELLTYKFRETIDLILRNDQNTEIPSELAIIVEEKCKKQKFPLYYIQWPGTYGSDRKIPLLWRYNDWKTNYEVWKADRERSDRERTERLIFQANLERLWRHLVRRLSLDREAATKEAIKILKSNCRDRKLKALEFESLITKESEL